MRVSIKRQYDVSIVTFCYERVFSRGLLNNAGIMFRAFHLCVRVHDACTLCDVVRVRVRVRHAFVCERASCVCACVTRDCVTCA